MLPAAIIGFNKGVKVIRIAENISKYISYIFFILILIIIFDLKNCKCNTRVGQVWTIYIYMFFLILSILINKFLNYRLKQIQPLSDISETIDPTNFNMFKKK